MFSRLVRKLRLRLLSSMRYDKKISLSMKALLDSEDDGADVADVNIDEVASDNE